MEDRELLGLAAKAARKDFTWRTRKIQVGLADTWGVRQYREELQPFLNSGVFWNPLENDGAAFRLSVDLQISVLSNIIRYEASTISLTLAGIFIEEDMLNQSPDVAARRAIVRAAAELGRMMP